MIDEASLISQVLQGVSLKDGARLLGLSIPTTRKRLQRGTLQGFKIQATFGECWIVNLDQLAGRLDPNSCHIYVRGGQKLSPETIVLQPPLSTDADPASLFDVRSNRQLQAEHTIAKHFGDHKFLPSAREINRQTHVSRHVAGKALDSVRRDLEREAIRTAYINSLVNRYVVLCTSMSKSNRALMNLSTSTLLKNFPNSVRHLTLEVPVLDDFVDLVVCQATKLADSLVLERLNRLLPSSDRIFHYAWRWERQHITRRIHIHIFCHFPGNLDSSTLKQLCRQAWWAELKELDQLTACDPFTSDDGLVYTLAGDDHFVHVTDKWEPYSDLSKYPNSYLSKINGDDSRFLPCVNQRVSFKIHCGVSDALLELNKQTPLKSIQCPQTNPPQCPVPAAPPTIVQCTNPRHKIFRALDPEHGDWTPVPCSICNEEKVETVSTSDDDDEAYDDWFNSQVNDGFRMRAFRR